MASKILEEKRKVVLYDKNQSISSEVNHYLKNKSSAGPLPEDGAFTSQANRLKANSNSKAIAVYLDSGNRASEEFSWLLKTYKLWNLQLEYDLVVYYNPAVCPPRGEGVVARPLVPMAAEDGFWGDYPFVNSFAMFRHEAEREWILDRYHYLLKTDCDVFLTGNLLGLEPGQVLLGYGGYMPHSGVGKEVARNLNRIFKNLCIPDRGLNHVGASIFGRAKRVLPVIADHLRITRHLLETEWINGDTGRWPGWYRGVASMYAIHLAVNKNLQANEVRLNALDSFCNDNKITRDVLHIHAWHCDRPWSKHAFFRGEYSEWKVDFDEAFSNAANYCQWVANLSFEQVEKNRDKIRLGNLYIDYGLFERKVTKNHFLNIKTKLSLLHATRGRSLQAIKAKELWIKKAKHPERVEHLFAIDADDTDAESLKQHNHVIQSLDGYSVGAWNLAASKCEGDILIQLSDDWFPPDDWDQLIASRLDINTEKVLWISDGFRNDDLMCMAILTRKYYEKNGLFDPVFKNVYSDNDFTIRAQQNGAVVDARDIIIRHVHPTFTDAALWDSTYDRGNQDAEFPRAKAIFEAKHFPKIYSQNDEQIVLERFFGGAAGILWDFGCNDGITLSNSHHLLKNKGWKGVLVDASRVCVEKAKALYSDRQDIQILNIGLGEKNSVLDFYESGTHLGKGDLSLVSSFKKESAQRWKSTTEYQIKQIQVYDFKTFLEDHTRYKTADFITIDIEGLDFEILSSIDLDQTQTRLVCVEHNGHDIQKYIDYCKKFNMQIISQNAENLLMGRNLRG